MRWRAKHDLRYLIDFCAAKGDGVFDQQCVKRRFPDASVVMVS